MSELLTPPLPVIHVLRGSSFWIGRSGMNDLVVPSRYVSRYHAVVVAIDAPWLHDLGSRNGTSINGVPIWEPAPISDGDIISLGGRCCFRLRLL